MTSPAVVEQVAALRARLLEQGNVEQLRITALRDDLVVIALLQVPKPLRRNGIGSEALRELTMAADRNGWTLAGTPRHAIRLVPVPASTGCIGGLDSCPTGAVASTSRSPRGAYVGRGRPRRRRGTPRRPMWIARRPWSHQTSRYRPARSSAKCDYSLLVLAPVTIAGPWLVEVDLDVHRLPDRVRGPVAAASLLAIVTVAIDRLGVLLLAGIGLVLSGGCYFALHPVAGGTLGFGDVKLAAVLELTTGTLGLGVLWWALLLFLDPLPGVGSRSRTAASPAAPGRIRTVDAAGLTRRRCSACTLIASSLLGELPAHR